MHLATPSVTISQSSSSTRPPLKAAAAEPSPAKSQTFFPSLFVGMESFAPRSAYRPPSTIRAEKSSLREVSATFSARSSPTVPPQNAAGTDFSETTPSASGFSSQLWAMSSGSVNTVWPVSDGSATSSPPARKVASFFVVSDISFLLCSIRSRLRRFRTLRRCRTEPSAGYRPYRSRRTVSRSERRPP